MPMNQTDAGPATWKIDPVVRLVVMHWGLGVVVGVLCAALLLWLDVGGLRTMLVRPDRLMWEGLVLLFGGFACTFGGVVAASAVMTVPRNERSSDGGGRLTPERSDMPSRSARHARVGQGRWKRMNGRRSAAS